MSESALAHDLIAAIAGHCWNGKSDMLDRVHGLMRSAFPQSRWTRRRIRSFWHKEAAGVRFTEMVELAEVAQAQERLENARSEHAAFVAQTASLAAQAARRPSISAIPDTRSPIGSGAGATNMGGIHGRMACAGVAG